MFAIIGFFGSVGFAVCLIWLFIALIRKKPKKKAAIALAICLILFVGGVALTPGSSNAGEGKLPVSNGSSILTSNPEPTQREEPQEQDTSEPIVQDVTKEDILSQKTSATYKDLLRTPDEYAGEYVVVTAKINQILEEGIFETTKYYFGRTDESGYEFYFDDEYCFMDKRLDDDTKLLEEDVLVVYGRFAELKKFSRALTGADVEIPVVEMLYVEILDENSAESAVIDTSGMTVEQQNAIKKAQSYLDFSGFSYEGLIKQLEYEGFPNDVAVYAADNCGADWNEQAAKKAKSYMEIMAFSKEQLIEQLEYEGFTHEQAVYGAEQNGY